MGTVASIAEEGKAFRRRGKMLVRMSTRAGGTVLVDDTAWMNGKARELQVWLAVGEAVGWEAMVKVTNYEG